MATPNVRNIRRVPGRLIKDPTDPDLLGTSPFGGTELGIIGAMEFRPGIQTTRTLDETIARTIRTTITAEQAVFAGVLRDFDEDALKTLFHNTTQGARALVINGRASGAGITRAGFDVSSKGFKLVFVPDAIDLDDFIIMYNAVPLIEEAAALQLSLAGERDLAVMFEAHPDTTGRDYDIGKRDDIEFP